jgi:hypothetical protein
MEIRYAYQEMEKGVPAHLCVPEGRTKPWGTSHAVLCAAEEIDGAPFVAINSDDYYGKSAFKAVYDRLSKACDGETYDYCMVGYAVGNTVTENGSVSRGVCQVDANNCLTQVVERTQIVKQEDAIRFTEDGETWEELAFDTPVSMNMWGFTPSFLAELKQQFRVFMEKNVPSNPMKAEFYLPASVSDLLTEGKASVEVLRSFDKWYGVTYAADKPLVVEALREMTRQGLYPTAGLWSK